MLRGHAEQAIIDYTGALLLSGMQLEVAQHGIDKLIKSMRRSYLKLDVCNGVDVKSIRENSGRHLRIAGFEFDPPMHDTDEGRASAVGGVGHAGDDAYVSVSGNFACLLLDSPSLCSLVR